MTWRHLVAFAVLLGGIVGLGHLVTTPDQVARPGVTSVRPVAEPVRLVVPRLGVDTPLIGMGLDATGAPAVPDARTQWGQAVWFNQGWKPGENGPAIISGHVDGNGHEGIFFHLKTMQPGDTIQVGRADGTAVTFVVYQVREYPKAAFPAGEVYGPTVGPELRLLTCAGKVDTVAHEYYDSFVAYARQQ